MSNQGFSIRVLLLVVVVGLVAGLGLGLVIAWLAWPAEVRNMDVVDLKASSQDDYIVLTASAFAFDKDVSKARKRLSLLGTDKLTSRLGDLARGLSLEGRPEASYVASLAMALGSPDKDLAQIAATPMPTLTSTPFPTAVSTRLVPTITPVSTLASMSTPAATTAPRAATATRTSLPRPSATDTRANPTATKTATPKPSPTTAPPASISTATQWIPDKSQWPGGVSVSGASVAPGQKYWKLVKALYCDFLDDRNNCANLPGGPEGWGVYVMIRDESGNRAEAPLLIGGSQSTDVKSASDMCNCNYSVPITDSPFYLGNNPSDSLSGMGMVSVLRNWSARAHVRYFLTFQLTTR